MELYQENKQKNELNVFQIIMNNQPSVNSTASTQLDVFYLFCGHMSLSIIDWACQHGRKNMRRLCWMEGNKFGGSETPVKIVLVNM